MNDDRDDDTTTTQGTADLQVRSDLQEPTQEYEPLSMSMSGPGGPRSPEHEPTVLAPLPAYPLDDTAWAEVVAIAVEKAKAGNMSAANIVRLVERFGRRCVRIDMPPILDAAGVARAQAALLAETFAGRIEPRHGAALSAMIENRRRSIETLDFEKELRALNDANAEDEKRRREERRR